MSGDAETMGDILLNAGKPDEARQRFDQRLVEAQIAHRVSQLTLVNPPHPVPGGAGDLALEWTDAVIPDQVQSNALEMKAERITLKDYIHIGILLSL